MNIFRPQKPYVFFPPIDSPVLGPVFKWMSDVFIMRRKFNMRDIKVQGIKEIKRLSDAGHAVLIAPNHSDHADPQVLTYLSRNHGLKFNFMAAREGFERKKLHAFVLQRCGAFSVDREGADIAAIKMAMQLLQAAKNPLVIFPEGEIYHHNEELDWLNEGVATILLRSMKKYRDGQKAYLVPTAMRYTYDGSVLETIDRRLSELENRITWKPRSDLEPVERIYRLGTGLLALKETEYFGEAFPGTLTERIENLRDRLVQQMEDKHGIEASGAIPARVKVLRAKIRKLMTDESNLPNAELQKDLYDDLDIIYLVVQLYSYPGFYLQKNASVHRIAETILKLEEDVLEEADYSVPRDVDVKFGDPIDVGAFLKEGEFNQKTGVGPLTMQLENQITTMLDKMA